MTVARTGADRRVGDALAALEAHQLADPEHELMRSAEEEMRKPIENTAVRRPIIRFYSNYDASLAMTPRKIRYNLTRQVNTYVFD